jgi:hypothetical protein
MSTAPVRTDEQRTQALAKALATRQERARVRAALRDRSLQPVDVLLGAGDEPVWAAMRVSWLLEAVPGIGPARAQRIMDSVGIAASRRIQGLGDRQRAALIALLGDRP